MPRSLTADDLLCTQRSQNVSNEPVSVVISCANNRFAQTVLSIQSFKRYHPNAQFLIVLADIAADKQKMLSFLPEGSQIIEIKDLNIPHFDSFVFQYSVYEVCCAAKCFGIQYAMEHFAPEKIIYADSDLYFFSPLTEALEVLNDSSIILTPERLTPTQPYDRLRESFLLKLSTFNGGFFGVNKNNPESQWLVKWMQERMMQDARLDVMEGYFTDQKWLDIIPSIAQQYTIIRHQGYNVPNLHITDRHCNFEDTPPSVEGMPIRFIHLAALDLPNRMLRFNHKRNQISSKSESIPSNHFPENAYFEAVQKILDIPGMIPLDAPHAYSFFADGESIHYRHRRYFRNITPWPYLPKNPFSFTRSGFERAIFMDSVRFEGERVRQFFERLFRRIRNFNIFTS
jgi:hypothetical protein